MQDKQNQLLYALLANRAASDPAFFALLQELVIANRMLLGHHNKSISDEDALAYVAVYGTTDEIRIEAKERFQTLTEGRRSFSAEQIDKLLKATKELLDPASS